MQRRVWPWTASRLNSSRVAKSQPILSSRGGCSALEYEKRRGPFRVVLLLSTVHNRALSSTVHVSCRHPVLTTSHSFINQLKQSKCSPRSSSRLRWPPPLLLVPHNTVLHLQVSCFYSTTLTPILTVRQHPAQQLRYQACLPPALLHPTQARQQALSQHIQVHQQAQRPSIQCPAPHRSTQFPAPHQPLP